MSDGGTEPKEGFKVVGRWCLPEFESVQIFATKEEARKEAKKWKKDAESQGRHMTVRVVKA